MDSVYVSIIIPTYNRAFSIEAAIISVLNQTYPYFQLLIVDDGSSDNTENIVSSIISDKITYLKSTSNKGACAARNLGIAKAKYEVITFLDSDDTWKNDYLENHINFYKKVSSKSGHFGLQFCNYFLKKDNDSIIMPQKAFDLETNNSAIDSLIESNFISTQTVLTTKSVMKAVDGFDENLPAYQDWDLAIRVAKNFSIFHLPIPLVTVEFSPDSISANHTKKFLALEYLVKKYANSHILSNKNLNKMYLAAIFYNITHKIKEKVTLNFFSVVVANPLFYKSYYSIIKYYIYRFSLKTTK